MVYQRKWCKCQDKCDHGQRWWYDFSIKGKRYRSSIPEARNKFQAEQAETSVRNNIFQGTYGKDAIRQRKPANSSLALMNALLLRAEPCSYIYCLQSGATGRIKIGTTAKPVSRFANYRTHSSEPLTIIGMWFGDVKAEARIHERFKVLKVSGEWFRESDDLMAFIAKSSLV
jgi:hypothetical protein